METITTLPKKVETQKAAGSRKAWLLARLYQLSWAQVALAGIMGLTAALYLFRLDELGYSNEYYATAVKSMLTSWHNFFFASFDAGGYITVDKPPVFLWIQAASAWLLGFSGFSIILPQVIAGVASVGLIYHMVRRVFGTGAGLVAALALALTPIFLVMSRHNNPESLLILSLLLAVWALTRATERGQLRWLLVGVGLVGVAFNIKMLEGFVILPAFYAVYMLLAKTKWWKRILHLGVATVVLAVVALSWTLIVDAIPADQRPFIGSSANNTVQDLILGYNGLGRVEGNTNNFGGGGFNNQGGMPGGQAPTGQTGGQFQRGNQSGGANTRQGSFGGQPGGMGGVNSAIAGRAGPLRLFLNDIGAEVSWLVPLALLGAFALIWQSVRVFRKRKELRNPRNTAILIWLGWLGCFGIVFSMAQGTFHSYYLVMLAPPVAALFGAGLMALWSELRQGNWLGWLLPVALLGNAAYQVYLLSAYPAWAAWLSPLVIGLSVIGASVLVASGLLRQRLPKAHNWVSRVGLAFTFALLVAPAAFAINQLYVTPVNPTLPSARPGAESLTGMLGNRSIWDDVVQPFWAGWASTVLPLALLGIASALLVLNLVRSVKIPAGKWAAGFAALALIGALTVSGFSANPTWARANEAIAAKAASTSNPPNEKLIEYLETNNNGYKYLVAVSNTSQAAPLILETGQPVMAIGGFMGSDNSLTAAQAAEMVSQGQVRYFLLSGGSGGNRGGFGSGASTNSVNSYVTSTCKVVDSSLYTSATTSATTATAGGGQFQMGGNTQQTLYDCGALTTTK